MEIVNAMDMTHPPHAHESMTHDMGHHHGTDHDHGTGTDMDHNHGTDMNHSNHGSGMVRLVFHKINIIKQTFPLFQWKSFAKQRQSLISSQI